MKNVSRLLPLLSGIVTLSGCSHAPQKSNGQNNQKPNIIYIFADDLGISFCIISNASTPSEAVLT